MKERETVFLGDVLVRLRGEHGMTQEELAEKIGGGSVQISRYERSIADPSLAVLKRLKRVFRVKADVFIDDDVQDDDLIVLDKDEKELIRAFRRGDFQKLMRLASKD